MGKQIKWKPGKVAGSMRIVEVLPNPTSRPNKAIIVECMNCGFQRKTWTSIFSQQKVTCPTCVGLLKRGSAGEDLAKRMPLALLIGDNFHVLWGDELNPVELHAVHGDKLFACINSRTFRRWTPTIFDEAAPQPPELVPAAHIKMPPGAIKVPFRFVPFLTGAFGKPGEMPDAEKFFIEEIQKGDPDYYPTLRKVEGVSWIEGGTEYTYLLPAAED